MTIEVVMEGKVGNVKRRVSDCWKDYGLEGLKSFNVWFYSEDPH
jgi:hypothetical protein